MVRRARPALTLIETLVVLSITGVLTSLFLPAVQKVRAAAHRAESAHHLRQIGLAMHHVGADHEALPPGVGFWPADEDWSNYGWGPPPVILGASFVFLLPYVEQDALWRRFPFMNSFGGWWERTWAVTPRAYRNPADPSFGDGRSALGMPVLCYAANAAALGNHGFTFGEDTTPRDFRARFGTTFPDGTSNTVLFAERYAVPGWNTFWGNALMWPWGWEVPAPIFACRQWQLHLPPQVGVHPRDADPYRPNGAHPGACLVALADGSVRPVTRTVRPEAWRRACLPNDGAAPGEDW